jgi:cytochrome c6
MYDLAKVKTQITNGKAAMPAFRGRLSEQQIEDVATYVLSQADKGW